MPELRATISADNRPFINVMRQTEKIGTDFARTFRDNFAGYFAGGYLATKLFELPGKVLNYLGNIGDQAEQLSLTTDEVQRITYAAAKSGFTFEQIASALSKYGAARKRAFEDEGTQALFENIFGDERWRKAAIRDWESLADILKKFSSGELNSAQRQTLGELAGLKVGPKLGAFAKEYFSEATANFQPIPPEAIAKAKEASDGLAGFWEELKSAMGQAGWFMVKYPLAAKNRFQRATGWGKRKGNPSSGMVMGPNGLTTSEAELARINEELAKTGDLPDGKPKWWDSPDLYSDEVARSKEIKQMEEVMNLAIQLNDLKIQSLKPMEKERLMQQQILQLRKDAEEYNAAPELEFRQKLQAAWDDAEKRNVRREAYDKMLEEAGLPRGLSVGNPELQAAITEKFKGTKTHLGEVAALQAELIQTELNNTRQARAEAAMKSLLNRSDSLLSIGNFAGMGNQPWARTENILAQHTQELKAINQNTKKLDRNTVYLPPK